MVSLSIVLVVPLSTRQISASAIGFPHILLNIMREKQKFNIKHTLLEQYDMIPRKHYKGLDHMLRYKCSSGAYMA